MFALEDQQRPLPLMDAPPGYHDALRFEAPRFEAPRCEAPRPEAARAEAPRDETPAANTLTADQKLALLLDAAKKRDATALKPF